MTPRNPYLVRALYEWIVDNEATPYILVNADHEQVSIPEGIANDGKVVLNLAPGAIRDLEMTNQYLSFSARFNGVAQDIYCPMGAVLAIYARENGEGMMFAVEDDNHPKSRGGDGAGDSKTRARPNKPGLKVVK